MFQINKKNPPNLKIGSSQLYFLLKVLYIDVLLMSSIIFAINFSRCRKLIWKVSKVGDRILYVLHISNHIISIISSSSFRTLGKKLETSKIKSTMIM